MATGIKPMRRVVVGNNGGGKSRVYFDGAAPKTTLANPATGRGHTDFWIWNETPLKISGKTDDGSLPYDFPGPATGGHFRVIQYPPRPENYDQASDVDFVAEHEIRERPAGRTWDRGAHDVCTSGMHKTQTVDYGIMLEGERHLILDDQTLIMQPGDIVIQVGAWHNWSSPRLGCRMAFDMIAADFVEGPHGLAQGNDKVVLPDPAKPLPAGVKPVRRIVTIDREPGKSSLVADTATPDVRFDPARPGFASARLWVVDSAPAKIVFETLHLPHTIEPPKNGSVCRVYDLPPDAGWRGRVGAGEVAAYFRAMGSPGASTYAPDAPHPYMQKTSTVDFCIVLEGEPALVLDTGAVALKPLDIVIQHGANHAWSNPTNSPCRVVVASHDAV